ncbi:hypothetical protein GCM10009715_10730 [Paeniglutamicibacter psychrophenolicus]|uniref:AAA+ ATPase domain-containing protein n=1 Tax=Paeniglutamicibacter psychrophenolicus TaxID=257454 RepID=A0ABS4WGW2_9MICC|nr:ATP-binding protein [Paeniglutamicibacter psychrophenolicus]MBP2375173.1 hypothetical protein [Paeniglutamicibacter psychrophenolicus]
MSGRGAHPAGGWTGRALRVLALRLRHEVALTRTLRGDGQREGFMGLLLTADEAESILAEAGGRLRASGTAESAAVLGDLEARLRAERRAGNRDPLCVLARDLGLDDAEVDLLLLAAAPSLDARYGLVYGYLNDDMTRRHLTPDLAVRLLPGDDADLSTVRTLLGSRGTLCAGGCLAVAEQVPWVQAAVRLDEDLLERLLGVAGTSTVLEEHGTRIGLGVRTPGIGPGRWLVDTGADAVAAGVRAVDLAARRGGGIYLLDAATLPPDPAAAAALLCSVLREAHLASLLPVLRGMDEAPAHLLRRLARILPAPLLVLSDRSAVWEDAGLCADALPACTLARTGALELLLEGHPANTPGFRGRLGRLERLDPLLLGRLLTVHREPEALHAAVRGRLAHALVHLAEPVANGYTLEDLVLPPATRIALDEVVGRQGTGTVVRTDWELGRIFGRGPGTTVLFKGPSGTGKTMAASAVANALALPLFRVNLAGLVSKYIGETEKNLDKLFEAASGTDVVLFFDEADAIFSKRSEVRDAHDRYANLETAYLLQRLETFAGVAILASNLHQNIDEAFLRRLDAVIDFPAPAATARRAIWRRLEQGKASMDTDVDLDLLAERFELTGGQIRNAALAAAHLAAADGGSITMAALMRAVGSELAKSGRPIRRNDFGEHYRLLRPTRETT